MTSHMLKRVEIIGFKSFAKKTILDFSASVTSIVGPNGSGKSNVAEAFRFALGEQSMKSMRGKRSEDLIFSGSQTAPRTNRAAVAIVFDNTSRVFTLDFDEVRVERAVLRDGTSEYTINDSRVRLRDIHELLSNANIGESGHHIISQGEADRILLADARKRREMLEDALGLASYEFKKSEAQRKLTRTRENMTQVEAMRRELTPRVHFLQKQVEKLERATATRDELCAVGAEYFAIEDAYLAEETEVTMKARASAKEKFTAFSLELDAVSALTDGDDEADRRTIAMRATEEVLERATVAHNVLTREIGRTEGALEALRASNNTHADNSYVQIPREDIATLFEEVQTQVRGVSENDAQKLRAALSSIHATVRSFFERFGSKKEAFLTGEQQKLHALEHEREVQKQKESVLCDAVEKARNAVARARQMSAAYQEAGREGQRHTIELAQNKVYAQTAVAREDARLSSLAQRSERCERKKAELLALVGSPVVSYMQRTEVSQKEYAEQDKRSTTIDRLTIRLEELGGTGEDIRKEYKEVFERESFLARELADLSHSADVLRTLIDDIDEEVAKSFAQGLERVNESFSAFFSLMFNGGSARLVFEEDGALDEDDDDEYLPENNVRDTDARRKLGIDVVVHIQKKKVQSLLQLSGGERALASIALIFAMSQVNPPPFLILDETDAALDEANSRRYGDMIENLSKKSQLIVITHNRETMSRAGMLYGVTMRDDGISRLLSVKFDEATVTAKR